MLRELVHAVWAVDEEDYSICNGVANYLGSPHYFEREYSYERDEPLATFALKPIDEQTVTLVQEQAHLLKAWRAANPPKAGHWSTEQRSMYEKYRNCGTAIHKKLEVTPFVANLLHARFIAAGEDKSMHPIDNEFEVEWANAA